MKECTVIPFGPQHPVLPEPLHFDLVLKDETIVDAIPQIGYIHRGLELLVEKREYQDMVFVAERICGICSFQHGMGYCMAVEEIMKLAVPDRAQYLRTLWCELSRIHSHLLWLGLAADAFGFENLYMACWRQRELILDLIEATTGGRVIFGVCQVGGVRRDVDADMFARILSVLESMQKDIGTLSDIFINDVSVRHRLCGAGVLSRKDAYELGAVGPMARASGLALDTRKRGYIAYGDLDFEPVVETSGDCYARAVVRIREIFQSVDLIRQLAAKIPAGELNVKPVGNPSGESFIRVEQPRGEVVYYVRANGTKFLERFRVRTPTFANVAPMIHLMKGSTLADVPNLVLTIDPCISCTER
jgi:Ni,Fe-hydrogenase III large subunit